MWLVKKTTKNVTKTPKFIIILSLHQFYMGKCVKLSMSSYIWCQTFPG